WGRFYRIPNGVYGDSERGLGVKDNTLESLMLPSPTTARVGWETLVYMSQDWHHVPIEKNRLKRILALQ
ncbi:hypothetical protein, partial [Enterobacter cloacae complex sp. 4DZ3-17B2]|uniref:hypothetical protein n=1 Tax=Enterobacter cloacae complex sp. 4DZ3-17B2 TaxID=2511990 RepID=UPI001CA4F1A1